MTNKPGTKGEPFYIKFEADFFNKKDILTTASGAECEVIKVYRKTWWRRLLLWLGFRVRMMEVKVITLIKDEQE